MYISIRGEECRSPVYSAAVSFAGPYRNSIGIIPWVAVGGSGWQEASFGRERKYSGVMIGVQNHGYHSGSSAWLNTHVAPYSLTRLTGSFGLHIVPMSLDISYQAAYVTAMTLTTSPAVTAGTTAATPTRPATDVSRHLMGYKWRCTNMISNLRYGEVFLLLPEFEGAYTRERERATDRRRHAPSAGKSYQDLFPRPRR